MNKFLRRFGAVGLGITAVWFVGSLATTAQESGKTPEQEAKNPLPYRRVPDFFNRLGISTEQREKVYAIRGKYYEKIAPLRKQIEELQGKELTECESLLTDAQKKKLDSLREQTYPGRPGTNRPVAEPAKKAD